MKKIFKLIFLLALVAVTVYVSLFLFSSHMYGPRTRTTMPGMVSHRQFHDTIRDITGTGTHETKTGTLLRKQSQSKRETALENLHFSQRHPENKTSNKTVSMSKSPVQSRTTNGVAELDNKWLPTEGGALEKKRNTKSNTSVTATPDTGQLGKPSSAPHNTTQRYLIYICYGNPLCGGWADRQRGVMSVYLLALATNRTFGMIMTAPCDIINFYVPNDVKWNITKDQLKGKTEIYINDMGSRAGISYMLGKMDFNTKYPQEVIYIRTNNGRYQYSLRANPIYRFKIPVWARGRSMSSIFANSWKALVRPSDAFKLRIDAYLRSIKFHSRKKPLVCAHVRIGKSETITTDSKRRINVTDVPILWDFLEKYVSNGSDVFLATDNREVRNLTRQRFGKRLLDTGGAIVHTDRHRKKDACVGFGDALLDQFVLSVCDVLVTSNSGFGLRASYVRGTSENLFTFVRRKVTKIKLD